MSNVSRETILAGRPARHNVDKGRTLWEHQAELRDHSWLIPGGWQGSADSVTANVDYVRLISRNKQQAVEAEALYTSLSSGMKASGFVEKSFGMQGYTGVRVGALAFGMRGSETLLQCAGSLAELVTQRAGLRCGRASRIDVAVTANLEEGHNEAKHIARVLCEQRDAQGNGRGRPIRLRLYDTFGEGDCLYIGCRSSRTMLRCYHKGLEDRDNYPPTTWRWELECKREVAHALHAQLVEASAKAPTYTAIVSNWLRDKGYETPFRAASGVSLPIYRREVSDDDKALAWLSSQVAPTVERLCSAGRTGDVFAALFQLVPEYALRQMDERFFDELAQLVKECYTNAGT